MITTTAPDGSSVRAYDEGQGPVILFLHGGMDEGASWARVAARLRSRFRVLRLHRRQCAAAAHEELFARRQCVLVWRQ
jgi:pimeloyl-ACP methyl ester carboxylesterase